MTKIQHLSDAPALKKIQELVERADFCLFTTALTELPLSTRPMSTQKAEENGQLWFFSSRNSHKDGHIAQDNRVQLFYSNASNMEFITLYGTIAVVEDQEKKKELWTPMARTWWESAEDPNLSLLQFTPESGYYWDTKDGKVISLLKMAVGTITGKEIDGSIEGEITPNP